MKTTAGNKKKQQRKVRWKVFHICPGLITLSDKISLLCFALIGLKSLWRHWPGARKTTTWQNSAEQSQEGTHGDAVNYAVVEFVMDVGSFSRAPSIITSTLGEILLGGGGVMKRRVTNEKTEQRWKHSEEERKVRPVVEITTTTTKKRRKPSRKVGSGSTSRLLQCSHHLSGWLIVKQKRSCLSVCVCVCVRLLSPTTGRRGGTTRREQIKFPLGKTAVAERRTEKNGRGGKKARLAASSKYW